MSDHKFRYMLPPGTRFQFVAKFKTWIWLSVALTVATVVVLFANKSIRGEYMNWTIDFSGGTEVVFAFKDKAGQFTEVDAGKVRTAFADAGEGDLDIGEIRYSDGSGSVSGMLVKTPRFSGLKPEIAQQVASAFQQKLADRGVLRATWSGDRLFVRSKKPISAADAAPVFSASGLELKPAASTTAKPDEGTGEYSQVFAIWGLDRQYQQILDKALPGIDAMVVQTSGVGAKAGDKLRDDAVRSLLYALVLIMLYLAFRFDIRYAPGAAFAVIHDAVMVIGVYAATWTEVSLTTVAALLTVMGYSVNETVISFDRIRENEARLKDKSIERIIDISINERLTRTVMTASTVFATTLIMNIFGTGLVKNFAFAMNIGVVVATYSSIFLAAPVFLWISKKWYSGPPRRRRAPPRIEPEPAS